SSHRRRSGAGARSGPSAGRPCRAPAARAGRRTPRRTGFWRQWTTWRPRCRPPRRAASAGCWRSRRASATCSSASARRCGRGLSRRVTG
ncbi:hypothetical protein IWQ57_003812, partial [Coemansia nantahalensis]